MENNTIKCLLVDDEVEGLDMLESLLFRTKDVEIVGKIKDPNLVVREIIDKTPDMIFLDINMPDKSGIEVLKEINNLNLNVRVVFVTAFDHFVFDALKNSAFDYLVKPIDRIELQETLIRYRQDMSKNISYNDFIKTLDTVNKIKINVTFGSLFFNPDDIVYFEADGAYTSIVLKEGRKEVSSLHLGKLEEKLNVNGFFRISRSVLINLKYLTKLDKKTRTCTLVIDGKPKDLPVSKARMHLIDEHIS